MQETLASFKQSLDRFNEVLKEKESITVRDASIQRFEFTVELAWKSIQRFLREEKIICRSPKECLREAFKFGLILDNPIWLQMIEDRNLTVHTYDENTASEVYSRLPKYLPPLFALQEKLKIELERI